MIEGIAMLTVLAGMGIYFVKSTDLPKDMRDRSAQFKNEGSVELKKKYSFPTANTNASSTASTRSIKLENNLDLIKAQEATKLLAAKRLGKIALIDKEIDTLTLTITALEQELKANNERNAEIQLEIDRHLQTLARLEASKVS